MPEQITRWMQHGACIGLMAVVAIACAVGAGLPPAETAPQVVQYHEANPLLAQGLTPSTADPTIGQAQQ